jgi:hypothetical protein
MSQLGWLSYYSSQWLGVVPYFQQDNWKMHFDLTIFPMPMPNQTVR